MQFFWRCSKASAPQVHEAINRDRNVTYSTVKTIIDRLEQKQALKRKDQQGRTIFYSAAISANKLRKPMLNNFIQKVFGGDKKQLINHLLNDEKLSAEDINYLQNLIDKQQKHHD
ncbi:MAG: BlaI/MecI/CopY family transcriptional regulator [Xanthomonadales bacterium]|nr:BlaI/MecI/CopY family transcriptional regulator [Xanthomonadales bacterium]